MAAKGIERSDDLGATEEILRGQLLRIGASALELHLNQQKLGCLGPPRPCCCGPAQRFVEHHPKTVATILGSVTTRRAYYRCRACGESCLPYDQEVGLGDGQVSVGLAKAATLLPPGTTCPRCEGEEGCPKPYRHRWLPLVLS